MPRRPPGQISARQRAADEALHLQRLEQVVRLKTKRMSYTEIGAALDPPCSRSEAYRLWTQAKESFPVPAMEEYVEEQIDLIDALISKAWAILEAKHYKIHQGMIVRDDETDERLVDTAPNLSAIATLVSLSRRKAAITGSDTVGPGKKEQPEELTAEVRSVIDELASRRASRSAG